MVETKAQSLTSTIDISTPGRGFQEITRELQALVRESGAQAGICHVFLRHTSASLLITENADPDVRRDLENFISRMVPDGDPAYFHSMEGPDDMPAHIRSVLTCSELTLPLRDGRLALGTWQGVYLWEHRTRPHRRRLEITIIGAQE
jgi:secondary thiamine-phosphate synthase enzyme